MAGDARDGVYLCMTRHLIRSLRVEKKSAKCLATNSIIRVIYAFLWLRAYAYLYVTVNSTNRYMCMCTIMYVYMNTYTIFMYGIQCSMYVCNYVCMCIYI